MFAGRLGSCFSLLSNVCWVCGRERSVKWGFVGISWEIIFDQIGEVHQPT